MRMKRIGPGSYESPDGGWEVSKHESGWIARNLKDRSEYSDPYATKAQAVAWIERVLANR